MEASGRDDEWAVTAVRGEQVEARCASVVRVFARSFVARRAVELAGATGAFDNRRQS
ncbi:hypothetical protein [Rathayibacter sp. AY1E2]|uniref:hypothetical protein n=1 Tax=Rathayibacter sp. AY1E2 TaxID=2080550 RepID=UPI0015E31E25|nr:hypothetical protein [Rathayibacter sp. AY1E2]